MRRFLLAVGVLLTLAVSTSSAGYLIIRVLLEGAGGPAGGESGGLGLGAAAGGPRGGAGGPPGTSAGGPPGTSAGGGGPPGTSAGGGGPPRGGLGLGGGMPSAGGMATAGPVGPSDPSRSIVVVIPFTKVPAKSRAFYPKRPGDQQTNPEWDLAMSTPFGFTNLFTDGATVQWYYDAIPTPARDKTRNTQITERYTAWQKTRGAEALFELTSDALEHGMVTEAVKYADELLAFSKVAKTPPKDHVQKFTQAYAAVWPKVTAPASKPNDAQRWREILDVVDARVLTQGHYSLVFWDASNDEVARRFRLLDENFKAFYLWHALQGVALDVPEKPLMAVLPRKAGDLFSLSRGLDGMPIEADAFYSPEHDILVLSPERVDDAGQTFLRQNQQLIHKDGLSRAKLLTGHDGPKLEGNNNKEHVARMMTLALVEKYAEIESELAGVSREGCRQLLYASGALPRHVVLPRWVSNGSANFFTRPKGPVYTKKQTGEPTTTPLPGTVVTTTPPEYTMTVALTTGYGGPNFVMQKYFRDMHAAKELNADAGALLRNVVTDAYFNALAKDGEDIDPLPKELVAVPIPKGGFGGAFPPPGGGGFPGLGGFGGVQGPPPGMTSSSGGAQGPPRGSSGGPPPGMTMGGGPPPGMTMGGGAGGMNATTGVQFDDLIAAKRKKVERLSNKSQATSWALYYYLTKNHKDGLKRFLDELSRLPRDLPIDEQTTLNAFARAFNLTTASASEDGKMTLAEFGSRWVKDVLQLSPAGITIEKLIDRPTGTGGAGAPGAMMPPPGFPGGTGSPDGGR